MKVKSGGSGCHKPNPLTVVVPAYNERSTVQTTLERLLAGFDESTQIIVVDDGSDDGTAGLIDAFDSPNLIVIHRKFNGGKTAAVRDVLALATGQWVIVQDADSEYNSV